MCSLGGGLRMPLFENVKRLRREYGLFGHITLLGDNADQENPVAARLGRARAVFVQQQPIVPRDNNHVHQEDGHGQQQLCPQCQREVETENLGLRTENRNYVSFDDARTPPRTRGR